MSDTVETGAPRRVLVTGATGLLGGNVVRTLLRRGTEVVALVRDQERAARLLPASEGLRLAPGDVTDSRSVRPALRGVDAVVHTAAYFREYYQPGADLDLLRRTNVTAVEDLLRAATDASVPVVVHVSSTAVLGQGSSDHPADEDTPPDLDAHRNAYRASKIEAEQVVARCLRGGPRVPLVLPAWMWGPGDAGPTSAGRLYLAVARGELRAVPRAGNHVVDARDVAEACVLAAIRGESGRRYAVAGQWWTMAHLCEGIARAAGVAPPRQVPARAALMVATALEAQARLRGRPPVATRAGVEVLMEGTRRHVSSARAQRELGVSFRPLEETLGDEADWYRADGAIPGPTAV
jgi:dihydroflavonol-4-reductase